MRRKKLYAVIMAAVMATGMLSGCGAKKAPAEDVTIESLLQNPFGEGGVTYIDADFDVSMTLAMDVSLFGMTDSMVESTEEETTGEEGTTETEGASESSEQTEEATESSSGTAVSFSLSLAGNAKADKTVMYTEYDLNQETSFLGISDKTKVKSYADLNSGKSYNYDSDSGYWIMSTDDEGSVSVDKFTGINPEYFNSMEELSIKTNDDGKEYTVKGTVLLDSLLEKAGDDASVMSGVSELGLSEDDIKSLNPQFDVTMVFGNEKTLKSMDVVYSGSKGTSSFNITGLSMSVDVNSLNEEVKMEIPSDVISSAEEYEQVKDTLNTEAATEEDDDSSELYDVTDSEDSTLAMQIFGTSTVSKEELLAVISSAYLKTPDDGTVNAILNLLNSYTTSKFAANLGSYESWNSSNRQAVVYLYGLGVLSLDDLSLYGISSDTIVSGYGEIVDEEAMAAATENTTEAASENSTESSEQ